MTVRTTIITSILALASVLAAAWIVRSEGAGGRDHNTAASPLFEVDQLPVDRVQRITLQRAGGGDQMVFERGDAGWMQVESFTHRMDPYSMRQLAVVASQVQVVDRLDSADTRGQAEAFGLAPPEATLTLEWEGGSTTLELGRRGIAGRAYLRFAGQESILVVNQALHDRAIEMNPKEWRDRSLFRGVGVESDRIVREIPDVRLVMERDRRQWRMLEPVRTRVDGENLDAYMQRLGAARAGGYVADQPDSLAQFGLAPPQGTLAVITARGSGDAAAPETQRLLIGYPSAGGDYYCMIEGVPAVIRVPAMVLQPLFAPAPELIDPTGTGVRPEDVKFIRIVSRQDEVMLERDLERWRMASHGGREVPSALVQQLLARLCETRASRVNITAYPRELEVATITLSGFDSRPLDTVRIVREGDDGAWGLENGDDVLRIFPKEFALPLNAAEFGIR